MPSTSNKRLFVLPIIIGLLVGVLSVFACNSYYPLKMTSNSTTFRVCEKTPERHHYYSYLNESSNQERLESLPQYYRNKCTEILQSSNFPANLYVSNNGFVNTVVDAYNKHNNLVIRPDDIWGAIMTQFSFYINKNAEEFRGKFVNFEGKKELEVIVPGSLRSAPYDLLVKLMTKEIDRNLVDPEVKKWILPNFSTTTDNDLVTIGVVFMASMKKYFDYKFSLMCGIPSITLEGTVEDWKNVRERLGKLKEYKLEKWHDMLEPILAQFVDAKQGNVDTDFWQRIAHYQSGGSGPSYISGWITAFCVFDKDGNSKELKNTAGKWLKIETSEIPTGIVEVNVKIDDNGAEYDSVMFAGHLAAELKDDGKTVQPTLGWVIALKAPGADESQDNNIGTIEDLLNLA